MSNICLNLVTRIDIPPNVDSLESIWSLDNWSNSLDRVQKITCKDNSSSYQRFELIFDASSSTADLVEIERFRRENEIEVVHLIPPPGINELSAKWWIENDQHDVLFSRRKIIIDESKYTPDLARKMFHLLRENIEHLIGPSVCVEK